MRTNAPKGKLFPRSKEPDAAELSTFDDWGTQPFDTIGWNSAVN
jgi:hypothetical protein